MVFQLIPARGRKPATIDLQPKADDISTYPRKGTETVNDGHFRVLVAISTYPRKGTETLFLLFLHVYNMYHPRKGAKTLISINISSLYSYHPRKGAKTYPDQHVH